MLKLIIIRHGEKPAMGDNLSPQGLKRALQLPAVLQGKFGIPDYVYVPALAMDASTSHSRMFQTVTPFAIQYNLAINTKFDERDFDGIADDLRGKTGTVLLVWEHHGIHDLVAKIGVKDVLMWADDDFDSIWIVTIDETGDPILEIDHQNVITT